MPGSTLLLGDVFSAIGHGYQVGVADAGRQPELLLYLAFLVTFGLTRLYTYLSKTKPWFPGSGHVGGVHVHHMVIGILLMLVVGYVEIAFDPGSPGSELLAVFFGVGAAFTLDEFALFFYLRDVYWAKEGHRSIQAVEIAAGLGALLLFGIRVWIDLAREVDRGIRLGAGAWTVAGLIMAALMLVRGRLLLAEIMHIGQQRMEIRADMPAAELARMFQQQIFGMLNIWTLHPPAALEDWVDQTFEVFWSGIQSEFR